MKFESADRKKHGLYLVTQQVSHAGDGYQCCYGNRRHAKPH